MFDFHAYIERLCAENRLCAAEGFHPCSCSGLGYIEDLLARLRSHKAFLCTSDTCEESTLRRGGAWFKRRVFTVFVLHRFAPRSTASYRDAIAVCREVLRQLHARFIRDEGALRSALAYLDTADVRSRELGGEFLDGCTGLYFMVAIDEPIDLSYDDTLWQTTTP